MTQPPPDPAEPVEDPPADHQDSDLPEATPPGQPRSKQYRRVIAAAALIVLAAIGLGLYFVIAGRAEREVRSVVDAFVNAVDNADEARIIALLCPEEAAGLTDNDSLLPAETSSDIAPDTSSDASNPRFARAITDIEVVNDTASARVARPDQDPFTLYLRKDAGSWKVCAPVEERFPGTQPS